MSEEQKSPQEIEEHIQRIKVKVEEYLYTEAVNCRIMHLVSNEETKQHIVEIGTNILANKWGINTHPGSFVTAVINNDLTESFSRADHVNTQAIRFYVMMMYNIQYVK